MYEPSEFEIIETFEFEEEVQLPEELRFFTLEEQLTDYFEKSVPKKKHVAKSEYAKIKYEVDRLRELYDEVIMLTDTYHIDDKRKSINVEWLKPIYGTFGYETYSFASKLLPLFEQSARRTPNYYPVLINALPKPYSSEGAMGVPVTEKSELVDEKGENPINVLGNYVRTKRIIKDDGSEEIINVTLPNTGDDIRRVGFYIHERPLNIPQPLSGHPFLGSSKSNIVMSSEPLLDVFPSIEAILSHAVPVTKDPYGEGSKYLKLYDVSLKQVRWKSWQERFPPVETISSPPPVLSVVFPVEDIVAPSDKVQGLYLTKWKKTYDPRLWLLEQEDGGRLISKMLLTEAGSFGVIAPDLMHEKPEVQLPTSTPEDCLKTENFEEFLQSGVYRKGVCAPTPYITQERKEFINLKKKGWTDNTGDAILRDYISLLNIHQSKNKQEDDKVYEKFKQADVSELRENVIIILKDDTLFPPDQSHNIRLLIKELTPINEIYYDASNLFVICNHTLAILDGDLVSNRLAFYSKWATAEEGARVCRFCGEQINKDDLVAQDEFDDDGRLVLNYEVLSDAKSFHGSSTFANSLSELRGVFNMKNAGETVVYFLLSALQVLPSESQLIPILSNIRKLSLATKGISKQQEKNRFEGLVGIAAMVVLLQTHNPFLVPRRSFGSKVVKLSGFPRDTDDQKNAPALDICLTALQDLMEASPTGFAEPFDTIVREVANHRKKVRSDVMKFILQAKREFAAQFESAKERYLLVQEKTEENDIHFPIVVPDQEQFKIGERQGTETFAECSIPKLRNVLVPKRLPTLSQSFPPLDKTKPSKKAEYIPEITIKISYTFPTKKEIEDMVKKGFPDKLKLDLIKKFVETEKDGVALSVLLSRILDIIAPLHYSQSRTSMFRMFIQNMNTFENKSLVRDAVKGMIYLLFQDIKSEDGLIEAIKTAMYKDLTMNMILLTKEQSEKTVDALRARERETLKQRLQELSDREREITKQLLDIGIAQYIFNVEDRRLLAKEFDVVEDINDNLMNHDDVPEGGFTTRDYIDGDEELNQKGLPIEVDRGEYGDMAYRPYDDYSKGTDFDDNGDI